MKSSKRTQLQKAGWKIGTVQEFLGLTDEEAALIEMKLAFAESVRKRRLARRWMQAQLANALGSSQSRIARIEAADATVSLELLIRALLALGATRRDVGRIIGQNQSAPAA